MKINLLLFLGLLAAAPAWADYPATVLADNPAGYWRLGALPANNITTNLGFIGSAGDGTNTGTLALNSDSPVIGGNSSSMNFDGGGLIALPYSPWLTTTNAFSYEVWYNEDPGSSGIRCPLWFRDEPVLGDTRGWVHYMWDGWDPSWNGARGNVFQSSDVFTTWNGLGSDTVFAQGEWQHLVCTFDGKKKQIFLDGVLIAVSTTAVLEVKPVRRAVTTISSTSYPWLGSLCEAAIYTNALPADRIQAHWLAAVGTNPPAIAATFVTEPAGATNFDGSTVTLSALVVGTPPFTYQWLENGTPVSGQTNATLNLSPARISDSGDYVLQVKNSGGTSTSSDAYVEIVTAPASIVQGPVSGTRLQGASATLTVDAGGSLPLSYQWQFNSTPIVGATNASLTLNDLQPSAAGNYSVTVTNAAGKATSPAASLTVVPASGSYAATVVRDMPVAYWRLDETNTTAYDLAGGHDGTYDQGLNQGVAGAILGDPDTAVNFPDGAGMNFPAHSGIFVPWSADLNPFTGFSVELWARPDPYGAGSERALFASRTTSSGWAYGYYLSANTSDQWEFDTGHKTSGVRMMTAGATTTQAWCQIIATFDASTGSKNLYLNGQLATNSMEAIGTFAPNNSVNVGNTSDQGIGKTTAFDPTGEGTYFYGDLDEVAVYGYALSPGQVAQHYGAATSPKLSIAAAGDKVVITWNLGLLLQASALTGPWSTNTTAVSPWTTTPAGPHQFFRVLLP